MRTNVWKLLVPLALVAIGLAVVLAVGTTATAAPAAADVQVMWVEMTADHDPPECGDTVSVTAHLCNYMADTATNVSATVTIDPAGALAFVSGPNPPMDDLDLGGPALSCITEEWTYTVVDGTGTDGYVRATVEAWASNSDMDSLTAQLYRPLLVIEPSTPQVCVGCTYQVDVDVTNLHCDASAIVSPTLTTDPPCQTPGPCEPLCTPLAPTTDEVDNGATVTFSSDCVCESPDPVHMEVDVDAEINGVKLTQDQMMYDPKEWDVTQEKAHLVARNFRKTCDPVIVGQGFQVMLDVRNTGTGAANDVDFAVGDNGLAHCTSQGPVSLAVDETKTLVADCICDGVGTAELTYTVFGDDSCRETTGCLAKEIPPENIEAFGPHTLFVEQIDLWIYRLEPQDGEEFVKSQTFDIQANFETVAPRVELVDGTHEVLVPEPGTYEGFVHAYLEFDHPEYFEVVDEPHPNPFKLADNEEGKRGVWWKVHVVECPEPGFRTRIRIIGETECGQMVVDEFEVVLYPGHPQLKAEIIKPRIPDKYVSQSYSVMAIITNTCGEVAIDVEATLNWDPDLIELRAGESPTKFLGDIPHGHSMTVMWTVHAKAPGWVTLEVMPKGRDDVTGDWIAEKDIHPGYMSVEQVLREDLDVSFVGPTPGGDKKIGFMTEFTIQAEVCNTGFATLDFAHQDAIWPELVVTPEDSLEVLSVDYGLLEKQDELKKHECAIVTWRVKCIRAEVEPGTGEEGNNQWLRTYFEVKAKGVANTCIDCFAEDSAVDKVIQKYLIVEILYPDDDTIWQPEVPGGEEECSEHSIRFAVTPYGGNLVNGQAKLTVDGVYVISEGSDVLDFNTYGSGQHAVIADGETAIFDAFHVKCIQAGQGWVDIEVDGSTNNPLATTYRNSDRQTVEQKANRSSLSIEILSPLTSNWFSHGDTFEVRAVIRAAGDPFDTTDAKNVKAMLSVNPEDGHTCEIVSGGLKGVTMAPGTERTVTWQVKCWGLCNVGLQATVEWDDFLCSKQHFSDDSNKEIVHMFPLKPVIYQYPNFVDTGSTFDIHAKVYNLGCECYDWECPDCGVPDVWATIEILEGQAELAVGEQADKYIGEVICPDYYPQEAEWTVKCLGPGTVKIKVKVWTNKDPFPGDNWGMPLPGDKILVAESDIVIVDQVPSLTKYTIQLCKDWNYFSLPLIPKDDTDNIESEVLASVYGNVVDVWAYDGFSGMWSVHVPDLSPAVWGYLPGLGELTDMVDGWGYIIRMNYPDIVEGEGLELPDPQFPQTPPEYWLAEGWNLIGFKTMDANGDGLIDYMDDMEFEDYLFNMESCATCDDDEIVGDEARYIYTYDCGYPEGEWKQFLDDEDCIKPGKAYWLYASEPDLSIVPGLVHPGQCYPF